MANVNTVQNAIPSNPTRTVNAINPDMLTAYPAGQVYGQGYSTAYAYDPSIPEKHRLIKKALAMDVTSAEKIKLISFVLDAS